MTTLQLGVPTHFVQKPVKGFGNLFVYDLRKQWLPGILEIEAESTETSGDVPIS